MERTIYRPLSTDRVEIRLLTLHPGSREDAVQGTLHHVFLDGDEKPKYESISYCWGDASIEEVIWINGFPLSVAANTASALRRVRLFDSDRVLWIDGVCIDQYNRRECSRQVPVMTEIYEGSCGNLVHLADDAPLASRAVNAVESVANVAWQDINSCDNSFPLMGTPMSDLSRTTLETMDSAALQELYGQPLFGRLWVVQEIVMAPKNIVFYGNFTVNLESLAHIALWLTFRRHSIQQISNFGLVVSIIRAWGLWMHFERKYYKGSTDDRLLSLWSLLRLVNSFNTTFLHDKVYSVLGLYRRIHGHSKLPPLLEPDYSRTPMEVFRDATRFMILERKSLDCLQDFIRDSQLFAMAGLPSWVPQWFHPFDSLLHPVNIPAGAFRASGESKVRSKDISIDSDPDCLSATGLAIDYTTYVSPIFTKDAARDAASLLQWILAIQDNRSGVNDNDMRTLGMTLISGMTWDDRRATDEYVRGLDLLVQYIKAHGALPAYSHPDLSHCSSGCASCFRMTLTSRCRNHRAFRTSSGLIGLGNENVAPGDGVVILQGGKKPFILRADGDEYNVVCDCYVHGIMDGEAWRGGDDERLKLFKIR